ncbi:MAG: hypothetical protein AAGG75_27590 [Bacteroidota bacterium]
MKRKPLLYPLLLCLLTLQLATAQTTPPADTPPPNPHQLTTLQVPDFDCYTDNTADFLYIEWRAAADLTSASFAIIDAQGGAQQRGQLRSTFTSKIPIALDKGKYEVVFYDEEGVEIEREALVIL